MYFCDKINYHNYINSPCNIKIFQLSTKQKGKINKVDNQLENKDIISKKPQYCKNMDVSCYSAKNKNESQTSNRQKFSSNFGAIFPTGLSSEKEVSKLRIGANHYIINLRF